MSSQVEIQAPADPGRLPMTLPLLFAGATIATTLGLVFASAHEVVMATYVTNLVELIGLALAVDYSLLVVYRFREELERGDGVTTPSSAR